MCKSINENPSENRRCDCDTSEARRLRRHNRAAINRNVEDAYEPIAPNTYPDPSPEDVFTVESIKEELASISDHLNLLQSRRIDGNIISSFVDKKLNKIGAGVEYIAENKYDAPTDEYFREVYESFRKPFFEYKKVALNAGMSNEEAISEANEKINADISSAMKTLFRKRNDSIRNAFIDIGVEFADPETLQCSTKSDPQAVKILKNALWFYPQAWVDASNELNQQQPLDVKICNEEKRANYRSVTKWFRTRSEINIYSDESTHDGLASDGRRVALHEFAHRIEHSIPIIRYYQRFFLMRRTGNYSEDDPFVEGEEVSVIYEKTYDSEENEEYGYLDNFPTHYMGKVYDGKNFEILSMGMESLFSGTNGGFVGVFKYKADSDYKRFILGVIASSSIAS